MRAWYSLILKGFMKVNLSQHADPAFHRRPLLILAPAGSQPSFMAALAPGRSHLLRSEIVFGAHGGEKLQLSRNCAGWWTSRTKKRARLRDAEYAHQA